MASLVLFEPAPAITGTLPLACSIQVKITSSCSLWLKVADSPVVPHGTRPLMPSVICHSTKFLKVSLSKLPLVNGVTKAVNAPLNYIFSPRL